MDSSSDHSATHKGFSEICKTHQYMCAFVLRMITHTYAVHTYWWHHNTIQYATLLFDLVANNTQALPGRRKLRYKEAFLKWCISFRRESVPWEKLSQVLTQAHRQIYSHEGIYPEPVSPDTALVKEAAASLRLGLVPWMLSPTSQTLLILFSLLN